MGVWITEVREESNLNWKLSLFPNRQLKTGKKICFFFMSLCVTLNDILTKICNISSFKTWTWRKFPFLLWKLNFLCSVTYVLRKMFYLLGIFKLRLYFLEQFMIHSTTEGFYFLFLQLHFYLLPDKFVRESKDKLSLLLWIWCYDSFFPNTFRIIHFKSS